MMPAGSGTATTLAAAIAAAVDKKTSAVALVAAPAASAPSLPVDASEDLPVLLEAALSRTPPDQTPVISAVAAASLTKESLAVRAEARALGESVVAISAQQAALARTDSAATSAPVDTAMERPPVESTTRDRPGDDLLGSFTLD